MTVRFNTDDRNNQRLKNSITKSQRSSCQIIFSRWDGPELITLENINAASEGGVFKNGIASAAGNLANKPNTVVDNDIVRATVTNNKGSSSGTFTLVLKRGKKERGESNPKDNINYLEVLHPGDWAFIFIKKSGTIVPNNSAEGGLKMVGIIENVRYVEIDDPAKGAPRLEYIVTGKSFGKIFDMSLYFNPVVATQVAQSVLGAGLIADSNNLLKAANKLAKDGLLSPDAMITALLHFFYGGPLNELTRANQTWYVPNFLHNFFPAEQKSKGRPSFIDILDFSRIGLHKFNRNVFTGVSPLLGETFIKSLPSSGTVWSIMQYLGNLGLNEMFVDLVNKNGKLVPALTFRQLPFSTKANDKTNVFAVSRKPAGNIKIEEKTFFTDLPQYKIQSSDIKSKNVGKSDFERINHIVVVPRNDAKTYEVAYVSALNIASIQRYGLKSFQMQTQYVLDKNTEFQKYCEKCVNLLSEWFFLNHMYYNGTIITDGVDGFVELGTNLLIEDTGQLYHIEGYTHNYEVLETGGIHYTTEFRVSRGQSLLKNSLEFIGTSPDKDGITISTSTMENVRNTPNTKGAKTGSDLLSGIPKLGK